MKLNMSAAWDHAVTMVSANKEVLLVLAGVFFFIPNLATALFLPEAIPDQATGQTVDPEEIMAAMSGFYSEYWWVLLLVAIISTIGMIAVLAVLGDRGRPTVGDAMARGVKLLPTQIAAQLGIALTLVVVLFVVGLIAGFAGAGAAVALSVLLALPILIYLIVKFSMAAPIIAIERELNPIAALRNSWLLTKGNSFRLTTFFALLLLAFVVSYAILTLVLGLLFALAGEAVARVGTAGVTGLLSAVFAVFAYAVLASVHRQLSAPPASVPKTGHD